MAMYDPPETTPERAGIMMCSPWAGEYFATYGLLRGLATRLSGEGYHVLRFDYYGCGDSGGVFADGEVGGWTDDACSALDELQALSAQRTTTVMGIRAGALVASSVAARRHDVDRLLLWDPVVTPDDYIAEMARSRRPDDARIPPDWPLGDGDTTVVLDGFPFTQAMGRSVLRNPVDPGGWRSVRSCTVVSTSDDRRPYRELTARAAEKGVSLEIMHTPIVRLDDTSVSAASLQSVVETIVSALR